MPANPASSGLTSRQRCLCSSRRSPGIRRELNRARNRQSGRQCGGSSGILTRSGATDRATTARRPAGRRLAGTCIVVPSGSVSPDMFSTTRRRCVGGFHQPAGVRPPRGGQLRSGDALKVRRWGSVEPPRWRRHRAASPAASTSDPSTSAAAATPGAASVRHHRGVALGERGLSR